MTIADNEILEEGDKHYGIDTKVTLQADIRILANALKVFQQYTKEKFESFVNIKEDIATINERCIGKCSYIDAINNRLENLRTICEEVSHITAGNRERISNIEKDTEYCQDKWAKFATCMDKISALEISYGQLNKQIGKLITDNEKTLRESLKKSSDSLVIYKKSITNLLWRAITVIIALVSIVVTVILKFLK